MLDDNKIKLGISSCLLGETVRYDGGHKRDRYITDTLSQYFEFLPVCPEVAIGLGVPRPTIRLESGHDAPRAIIKAEENRDVSHELDAYGQRMGKQLNTISGYILKSRSPSCGMERVKVYDETGMPTKAGSGIYAKAFMQSQPLLPVEEEGRLNDPPLRDNFIERVFVYYRWQCLQNKGMSLADLIQFHTEHKYLIMAYNQDIMRELGRMVAGAKQQLEETCQDYISKVMQAMRSPAKRGNQFNVLQHISGFFKDCLSQDDRQELNEAIEHYKQDEVPIIVPLTLIRHHIRNNPSSFLGDQVFLKTRPKALDTRRR